ncbi:MAG: zinc ribbon domain-containing protein [Candidatus Bathyarchaeia archaeon]
MWWKIKITRVDEVHGEGKFQGTYRLNTEWSTKYEIVDVVSDEVRIRDSSTYSWNEDERYGFFARFLAGIKKSGSGSYVKEWSVDRSTAKVLVAPSEEEEETGRPYFELINPEMAYLGAEIPRNWVNLKGEYEEKKFKVSEAEVKIKGFNVKVWDVYYSGESSGLWLWWMFSYIDRGIYPTSGYLTAHSYYDKDFGVVVGAKLEFKGEYKMGANYISQKSIIEWKFIDSNMWCVVSFDAEPRVVGLNIDGKDYPKESLPKSFLYISGANHTIKAQKELIEGNVRYLFNKWSSGDKSNELTIVPEKDATYKAEYTTQYRLIVKSAHGQPKGEGWYDAGTVATFSIQPEIPFLSLYVFDHWSGDSNAYTPEATIVMNSPKTVEAVWKINYMSLFILIGLTILVIAIAFFAVSKLKAKHVPPPIPPTQPSSLTIRRCPKCGAEVPLDADYCIECGGRVVK